MASYALLSSDNIHHLLDDQITFLSNPWTATILFPVFAVLDMKLFPLNIFNSPPEEVDICKYLTAQQYPTERLYFPHPNTLLDWMMHVCNQKKVDSCAGGLVWNVIWVPLLLRTAVQLCRMAGETIAIFYVDHFSVHHGNLLRWRSPKNNYIDQPHWLTMGIITTLMEWLVQRRWGLKLQSVKVISVGLTLL